MADKKHDPVEVTEQQAEKVAATLNGLLQIELLLELGAKDVIMYVGAFSIDE